VLLFHLPVHCFSPQLSDRQPLAVLVIQLHEFDAAASLARADGTAANQLIQVGLLQRRASKDKSSHLPTWVE